MTLIYLYPMYIVYLNFPSKSADMISLLNLLLVAKIPGVETLELPRI